MKKKTVKKKNKVKKKTTKKKNKKKTGRKLFDGKNVKIVIQKCEEVWSIGGSDAEAAFYADISTAALSDYLKKHSDVSERKDRLKEKTILKARREVVIGLNKNPDFSMKYLERKKSAEFGSKYTLNIKGVGLVVEQVVGIINKHVKDVEVKKAIADELKTLKYS